MTWLFQPLPLGAAVTNADASVALDASATAITSAAGTLGVLSEVPLSGSASTGGAGTVVPINFAGQAITSAQGDFGNTHVVRLRSRKVGGIQTAEHILNSNLSSMATGSFGVTKSVLLGGTGVAVSQNAFAGKQVSVLLQGQQRQMSQGFVVDSNSTGFIPSWVQLPTQLDEETFYDTDFGSNTGKDQAWTWTSADKVPTNPALDFPNPMGALSPIVVGDIHDDLEADDLWNHYMQYKRTGRANHLVWAQAWRDWYVNTYVTQLTDPVTGKEGANQIGRYDHIFGQGLCMWGMEQNDAAALNTAAQIAAIVETAVFTTENLQPGVDNMSNSESRRRARWLLFMCYYTMVNPASRWITLRDHLIDCWVQSPGWEDTTTPGRGIVIGGNHFSARGHWASGGDHDMGTAQYDMGYRGNSVFQYALHTEALWLAYKMTDRTDVRDMLIKMAQFTLYYAWDPTHANPFMGTRWGHFNGAHWHSYQDPYSSWPGVGPPDPVNTDPNLMPTDNYEASAVNTLVYGYKLTGDVAMLKRAREHLRQATCYANDSTAGGPYFKLAQSEVHFFLDTHRSTSETRLFDWNKGMLQYAAHVFENGGLPDLEESATWQPPYLIPTAPGEVVPIAGQVAEVVAGDPTRGGGSQYPTNVMSDIRPSEIGSEKLGNQMLSATDSTCAVIESYSQGGALAVAGTGGHHGTVNFGAIVFDFEDARWKRVWTGGTTNQLVDVRVGTRIHNCINYEEDLFECYRPIAGHTPPDWNSDHWNPSSLELQNVPRTTDPRDQTWEVSRLEPAAFNAITNPHGWLFPGEWNGDHSQLWPGRFTRSGYVAPCLRFEPSPAGTLAPTQSEMPIPAHAWDMMFEMSPDDGGGDKGSIVLSRHLYAGQNGVLSTYWSHRFDLDTGIWHQYSTNSSERPSGQTTTSPDAEGSITGCLDVHPTTGMRRYFVIGQRTLSKDPTRLLYLNLDDRTWRSATIGTGNSSPTLNAPRTEAIACDPDRRLLILTIGANPASSTSVETHARFRAFDLSTLTPEPNPTTGTGGWRTLPVTAASGFSIDGNVNPYLNIPLYPWNYYPPNGKYYRLVPNNRPIPTSAEYHANTAAGRALRMMNTLQRLTPPPIIANPPAGYYFTQPWTYDEITLNTSIPRGSYHCMIQAAGNQFFKYIPSLQCFAWYPIDHASVEPTPSSRHCVYLIKPI